MTILDEIAIKTRLRIEEEKKKKPLEELKAEVEKLPVSSKFLFKKALMKKDISFICEVKKASPSKGIIAEDFPYIQIAKDYEKAGADALSVLTEPYYFKGSNEYLKKIRKNVNIPILRKDFTIDEYMIYEAKLMGADAVLLICAILSESELKRYMELARSLGLSVLVEAHNEQEIGMALAEGAEIIGVNNRNLKNFTVDINNSIRLRKLVREEIVFISESGIKTAEDIDNLRKNGTNAVLIGETLMRSEDKKSELDKLRGRR